MSLVHRPILTRQGVIVVAASTLALLLLAAAGAWLFIGARSKRGKALALLVATLPAWGGFVVWAGVLTLINASATGRYGVALYGYGAAAMCLVAFAVEAAGTGLAFRLASARAS